MQFFISNMSRLVSLSIPVANAYLPGFIDEKCGPSLQSVTAGHVGYLPPVVHPYGQVNGYYLKRRKSNARHPQLSRFTDVFSGCRCHGKERASGESSASDDTHESSGKEGDRKSSSKSGSSEKSETSKSPGWDLEARHKQLQAVAAKMGDPLRDIMSIAGKKLQNYFDNYKNARVKDKSDELKLEWDWQRWQAFFEEVEEKQNVASALMYQLEDAIATEDFSEAARLKKAIAAATADDTVAEIMSELKKALQDERYHEAAKLRDEGGAGLVGWWVGRAEGSDDPYGRIVHIASARGRYIAKGYSARQLSTAAPGVPLFEVFVRKDFDKGYQQQAIYLQREGGDSAAGVSKTAEVDVDVNIVDMRSRMDQEKDAASPQDVTEAADNNSSETDDGLNRILNFVKDRMPDVKLKVFKVTSPDAEDIPRIVEQLLDEVTGQEAENGSDIHDNDNETSNSNLQRDNVSVGNSGESIQENPNQETETSIRVVVGGVIQNLAEDKVPKLPIRVPARIEHKDRDSFFFHIEGSSTQQSMMASKEPFPSWKVATISTQASADLMPPDVAKVLWNVEKVPVKVSKEVGEFLKLAVSQVQKRRGLFKCTSFKRIKVIDASADPFSGLYIGAFGPYTSELVQLSRKYGNWQTDETRTNQGTIEFFEYVEAMKLTGDLNVPAGEVTFRAKVGRECRLPHRGIYPEELGVVARFKGQGRLAEPGFRNPLWIDGELVLLDGKFGGHTNGTELGFVYSVPERNFLVLFNRLKLED